MTYDDLIFKIPIEPPSYYEDSAFVIRQIRNVLDERRTTKELNDASLVRIQTANALFSVKRKPYSKRPSYAIGRRNSENCRLRRIPAPNDMGKASTRG